MTGIGILLRTLASFAAIATLGQLAPGFGVDSVSTLVLASLLLAATSSLFSCLTLPFFSPTSALLLLLPLNLMVLYLTHWLVPGFFMQGIWWALLGALVLATVSTIVGQVSAKQLAPQSPFTDVEVEQLEQASQQMRRDYLQHQHGADLATRSEKPKDTGKTEMAKNTQGEPKLKVK